MNREKVDILLGKIGDPGKFQLLTFFAVATNSVLVFSNFLSATFFAAKTKHHCKLGDGESLEQHVPIAGWKNNEPQWDGCRVYVGNNSNVTEPCRSGWTYYLEENEATIISDFDLVCQDAYKSDLSSTIFFAGVMIGSLVVGYFADRWGRKFVTGVLQFISIGLSLGLAFTTSFVSFSIVRFFLGFILQGVLNTAFVLGVEIFQTKYRAVASVCYGLATITGGAVLVVLAYLIRDWKYIQLGLTVLPVTQLAMLCFVPESLRWLFVKKKFKDAEAVIKRIVSFNKLPFPREDFDNILQDVSGQTEQKPAKTAGIVDLFKVSTLRNRTIFLSISWFTVISAFYALSFNISFLSGDKYLNFGISLIVDLVGILLMIWAAPRFGSRRPIGFILFLCGVANVIAMITQILESDAQGLQVLGTITSLLGKSCAFVCLITLFGFTSELYPTVIRNITLGINTFLGRVGGMAAPQILLLGTYTSPAIPYAIIGSLAFLSAFLILRLPETHNIPLIDTIEEAKQLGAKTVVKMAPTSDEATNGRIGDEEDKEDDTNDNNELIPLNTEQRTSL